MKKQDIINKIKKDFKGRAFCPSTKRCSYLTSDNKKCVIGLFLPNNHKSQKFDGDVLNLLDSYPELEKFMPSKNEDFLEDLQVIHDQHLNMNDCLEDQKQTLINWIDKNYGNYDHNQICDR